MSHRLSTLLMFLAAMVGSATPHQADAVARTDTSNATSLVAPRLVDELPQVPDTTRPAHELRNPEWSGREGGDTRSGLAVLATHTTRVAALIAVVNDASASTSWTVRAATADSRAPPLN